MNVLFKQVDVFSTTRYGGNPFGVVLLGDNHQLTSSQMQKFAAWTNLSETTFILPPTHIDADYQLKIYTTTRELPFAGHPTLGMLTICLLDDLLLCCVKMYYKLIDYIIFCFVNIYIYLYIV